VHAGVTGVPQRTGRDADDKSGGGRQVGRPKTSQEAEDKSARVRDSPYRQPLKPLRCCSYPNNISNAIVYGESSSLSLPSSGFYKIVITLVAQVIASLRHNAIDYQGFRSYSVEML